MSLYKKKFNFLKKNSIAEKFFNTFLIIIIINWFFQGIRGMQSKEFIFRIIFELLWIFFFYIVLEINFIFSIILSHTLFWIFFCQFWVIMRYSSFYSNNINNLNKTYKNLLKKIQKSKYLEKAVIIGSIPKVKQFEHTNSDLDLRFFFSNNINDFLIINFFLFYLRTYAFFKKFPLDVYSYDNFAIFKKFNKKDKILIIKDKNNSIKKYLKKNGYKL